MNLPTELLQQILRQLSLAELASCARVSRVINESAVTILYRDMDLSIYHDADGVEELDKTFKRQRILLSTLADKPKLAQHVQSFRNDLSSIRFKKIDVVIELMENRPYNIGRAGLRNAARNMTMLRHATLTCNELSATLLDSISAYSHLRTLSLHGICPKTFDIYHATLPITKLSWDLPLDLYDEDPRYSIIEILDAIVNNWFDLVSLEVSGYHPPASSAAGREPPLYSKSRNSELSLAKLQHLALRRSTHVSGRAYDYLSDDEVPANDSDFNPALLTFIQQQNKSLTSLAISIEPNFAPEDLDFILQACTGLPQLISLTLSGEHPSDPSRSYQYLTETISTLVNAHPLLQRFSMKCIGSIVDSSVGKLFAPFTNLKFLHLGDGENADGPFAEDGRIDFNAYSLELLNFVRELPPSLEEIYLVVNGEGLTLDEDEDFDPMCNIGIAIFSILRRLHTCDIIAWISNLDGGLGSYPEKAVHWRRLQHVPEADQPSQSPAKVRDILQTRMYSIYQEDEPYISRDKLTIELEDDEGVFEGRDAEDTWFTSVYERTAEERVDHSWPWCGKLWQKYPLYKQQ